MINVSTKVKPMKSKPSEQVINTIEALCGLGCTQVNQLIDDAKNGKTIEVLSEFDRIYSHMVPRLLRLC